MPDHADTISTKAVISGAEPQVFVADIKASCNFFTSKLGFAIAFSYGEPPFYAQVMRDGARLNLRCVEQPLIDAGVRDRERLLSASLTVATPEAIKALFLEFQTAGVTLFQTLKREPGARETLSSGMSTGICCCSRDRRSSARSVSCPGRGAAFFTLLRRAGTHGGACWIPDQQRTTPRSIERRRRA